MAYVSISKRRGNQHEELRSCDVECRVFNDTTLSPENYFEGSHKGRDSRGETPYSVLLEGKALLTRASTIN